MRPNSNVLVIDKECPRWLYEVLRRLGNQTAQQNHQLSAIERGESPSSGGGPLISNNDHGELLGLYPDDDHPQYALLRGRVSGQTLNGSIDLSTSSSSFPWSDAGVSLITAGNNTATTSWNRVINVDAPVNNILIVSLATHSPGAGYGAGSTNYHTTVTDSKGNTWQKLGEFTTAFFAGTEEQTNSLWLCLVTSGMTTAGSDSLTFTFSNSMGTMAVESRQFAGAAGLIFTVAGTATGGNVDSLPPSLSISGLSSREYLFIRGIAVHDTNSATNQVFTATASHTAFTTNHADSTVPNGGANRGINARGEFRVLTGTADTTNPTLDPTGFPDDSSLMVAVQIGSNAVGDLILESINHSLAAKITLHNSTTTINSDYINFRAPGSSTTQSYIRGSDGALIDKLILATEGVSDPGAGNYLQLLGFNNPPIAGTTSIASRSAEIIVSKDVNVYADNFLVVERNTSYNASNGFSVATGLGYVAVSTGGTQAITGNSASSGTLLAIDHSGAGLAELDLTIKKRATQTGDMTQWQDNTGAKMSYIRASDGAFVGPIVVTGTDTHLDNVFQILDNADNTKIAMFECSTIATGTTRTLTVPNASGTLILSTGAASTAQTIGTFTPTGVANADDLALSGRLMIATTGSWAAGQNFRSTATSTATIGTLNAHQMTLAVNASGSSNATYRALLSTVTGGSSITSGSPTVQAFSFTTGMTFGAGVAATEVVALDMNGRITSLGAGSTCGEVIGLRAQAQGITTNIGDTYAITNIIGIKATLTSGTGKTTNLLGLDIRLDVSNDIFGFNNAARAINLDNFGDTTTTWGSTNYTCTVTNGSNVLTAVTNVANIHTGQLVTKASIPAGTYVTSTNVGAGTVTLNNNATANDTSVNVWGTTKYWSGIYRAGELPSSGEVVNARFIDNQSSITSQHSGNFYIGLSSGSAASYTPPTARVHIGASLTSAGSAPLKFDTGALMTTAEAGAFEFVTDDLYFTITTGAARKGIILNDGTNLTSGRIPFATTNGRLIDDADFTFAVDTLTITKIAATQFTGNITIADTINLVLNTGTGTKIGTGTTQKLGFWNTAPIVQPTTGVAAATFVANTSGIVNDSATFDGYTLGQVVKALRNMGLLA